MLKLGIKMKFVGNINVQYLYFQKILNIEKEKYNMYRILYHTINSRLKGEKI